MSCILSMLVGAVGGVWLCSESRLVQRAGVLMLLAGGVWVGAAALSG